MDDWLNNIKMILRQMSHGCKTGKKKKIFKMAGLILIKHAAQLNDVKAS